jgi:hypothetical protein
MTILELSFVYFRCTIASRQSSTQLSPTANGPGSLTKCFSHEHEIGVLQRRTLKPSMSFAGINGQSCSYQTQAWICTLKTWTTMKAVCFVLSSLVMWKPPKSLCLWPHSWYYWKALHEYGCTELVSWCLDILVQELLNIEPIFSLKI